MSRRRIQRKSAQVAAVIAMVAAASVFIMLRPAPEEVSAVSADGRLRVTGYAPAGASLSIERLDGVQPPINVSPVAVYEITMVGRGALADGELILSVWDDDVPLSQMSMYTFDRDTLSWIVLPTFFDLTDRIITAPVFFSGSILAAVGERPAQK